MKEEYLLTSELEYTNEPYAIAKIAGIKMCESYNIQYGTNFIAVQPTNLYGPFDNFDLEKSHVLPALLRKIHLGKALAENNWETIRKDLNKLPIENINGKSNEKDIVSILSKYGMKQLKIHSDNNLDSKLETSVEIWGSGKPKREFLWSEDMADACVHLMEHVDFNDVVSNNNKIISGVEEDKPSIDGNQPIRNTHINIGTGKDISVKQLAEIIKGVVDYRGDLYFNTSKPDGTMRKLTDSSKLENLGWKYSVELEEGIKRMYNWYLNS